MANKVANVLWNTETAPRSQVAEEAKFPAVAIAQVSMESFTSTHESLPNFSYT